MVFVVVVFIAVEAIRRLLSRHSLSEHTLTFGLVVMGVSALGSLLVSAYIMATAKRTSSTALLVNAQHLKVDFITSLGVFVGLVFTRATGIAAADPIVALLLATWISYGAVQLCIRAFQELIDVRLPGDDIKKIRAVLESERRLISYHRLRTRQSGSVRYIDLHIVVPREWNVVQAHEVADQLEKRIREDLAPAEVVIHVDPYDARRVAGQTDQKR